LKVGTAIALPTIITAAGDQASRRFVEFFTANIRNPNTRRAYARAARDFCSWAATHGIELSTLNPVAVAAYIEELGARVSKPAVKQSLAALRMLFDYLVLGHVLPVNPAASVRGPKYVVKKGKTPVLSAEECRQLLDSIDLITIGGLRDRALIGVLVFSFARIGAVVGMNVADYYQNGKRWWFRLHEKGGKFHEVPAHHKAEEYMDAYLHASGIAGDHAGSLFRTLNRHRQLTEHRLHPNDALRLIKRHVRNVGLPDRICCHTFRATGITEYLRGGGTLENAAKIAAHESTRTTQLYARLSDEITLDEIERVII
jgi:site-specific recombinase XerD